MTIHVLLVFMLCSLVLVLPATAAEVSAGTNVSLIPSFTNASTNGTDLHQYSTRTDGTAEKYPLMHFTPAELDEMQRYLDASPKYSAALSHNVVNGLAPQTGSKTLLPYISYVPAERNQGKCGDCWVWASTGALEIDHAVKTGINNRLSIQYFNSKFNDGMGSKWACCGGSLYKFTSWYNSDKTVLPWSNTNASFGDQNTVCEAYQTSVPIGLISSLPRYNLESLSYQTIDTYGVGQDAAINNIKSALNANQGVYYVFYYGTLGWNDFNYFWGVNDETSIFNPDSHAGETETGGHAVIIVGYNETVPGSEYWLVLNSWGSPANRPHGLFRLKMDMNYDATYKDYGKMYQQQIFQIVDSNFPAGSIPVANFIVNVTSGTAPLAVKFTDTSSNNPTTWNWSFGDGNWFNTTVAAQRNTTHTYTNPNTYIARLMVVNYVGANITNLRTTIRVSGPSLTISASPTTVTAGTPTNVNFTVKKQTSGLIASGATVTLTGVATGGGTTDTVGNASISVNAGCAGIITATASKAGYTSGTTTVIANALPTSITVTSPNGGETWKRGTSQTISWSYRGSPGSYVKIVLLKGSQVGTITSRVPIGSSGKGSYTWPILSSGYTGSDYKVSIQSISQPTIKDTSDNYFTVTSATTTPSITVISPNGGEKWYKYTTHTITWTYTGNPGSTVKIVIIKGSTVVDTFNNVPIGSNGKGSYSWWIKTSYPSGSDYKVSVQSISQLTIKDTSNANFGISWL